MAERRYRVGDAVRFQFGEIDARGVIKEDIGAIGVGGRRLYGIEFAVADGYGPPWYIELPACKMEPVANGVSVK